MYDSPDGPQVAAFFDLDRTLIEGFSAVEFAQERIIKREMSSGEMASQLTALLMYATGSGNFASLAAVGAKGVKGAKQSDFMQFGEEVARKHLIKEIYPEARALIAAHFAKGHTVCIVSAATPYQVEPIAAELGIEHVLCTRLEVVNGRLTGEIVPPACWGEGKAIQARTFAEANSVDLAQSYFYTDSHDDLELLDIVGKPRPINPDKELSAL
ncbi:MAG TPA: HAD family hydrolase, partial [Anaerolineae bacterium]|nr:HAD family hydrolase [Anaerolineae bacterium]